ncbi:Exocyst complex component exo70h1 [Thalictrum thalictroides]|uniref:Exocyst subunit Exo70 family protein n=1 Tax=Thalictrum thalictroides TaxID=46969 RepID=A0A7J6X8C7_THATH|nr:Exocyst complex component exo70h1 [Thalictrum thalictroides]
MRNIFSSHHSNSNTSSPSPSVSSHASPTNHQTFSQSLMDENIEIAEAIIKKWNTEGSTYTTVSYLFTGDRKEAKDYLKSIKDLQKAMHFLVTEQHTTSEKLINAQILMQMAMKRLEKEFYQMLSTNRAQLDPESISGRSSHASDLSRTSTSDFEDEIPSEDEIQSASDSISEVEQASTVAMSDLRSIAECMISAGYGRECVKIYNIIRKSIVDEGLYKLGIERLTSNQILKLDWDVLDFKIKNWVGAVKIAVKTLFHGERILVDYVFCNSDSIRESCFTEITKEGANYLFSFPEFVGKGKKSPEKMFRILDLYDAISELWPEIESIFSFESTSSIRKQAVSSLIRLGDAVRSMLTDFEAAIQKDSSKSAVPGGGVHPLTRYVMNYICFLSEYTGILSDITADWPLPEQTSLPDFYFEGSDTDDFSTSNIIALRFAWLVLVLLCKLDGKTELLKDVSLSYLFLANNLQYVLSKVRSSNLKFVLGGYWISKQELKLKQYCSNYERMGWSKVLSSLPDESTAILSQEEAKQCFQKFNSAFETAYRTQSSWVVSDGKLRDEIKVSICKKLVPVYQEFYDKYRVTVKNERNFESLVRFTPDDLGNYLSDLFYGNGISGSSSSRGSQSR